METRNVKSGRFEIENLEERIAPGGVSQLLGDNSGQVDGSVNITAGPGGASGSVRVITPGTTVFNTIGSGPA